MNSTQTMTGKTTDDIGSPGAKRRAVDTIMNQLLDSVALTARPALNPEDWAAERVKS